MAILPSLCLSVSTVCTNLVTMLPELTLANVQKGFSSTDADGEKLASICQEAIGTCQSEGGKKLLQSLASSLEKMM